MSAPSLRRSRGTSTSEGLGMPKSIRNASVVIIAFIFVFSFSGYRRSNQLLRNKESSLAIVYPTANKMEDDDYYTKKQIAEYSNIQEHLADPDQNGDVNPFVTANCDLTGVEWYPTGSQAWEQRTPYFLLIGAKKAGTSTLWRWINQHPWIIKARTKELLYFLPTSTNNLSPQGKVSVMANRAEMHSRDYNVEHLIANDAFVSFEATPGYLFYTTTSLPAILCTCPWVKLLVVLREPADRIFSHFNFAIESRSHDGKKNSLEDWIDRDMKSLRLAGVIQNEIPNEHFYGSDAEKRAWATYLSERDETVEGIIGRSLYILQIEAWYQALIQIGRDPETEFMVVRNEDMRTTPHETYNKILWWLELPAYRPIYKDEMKTKYSVPFMTNATRTKLKTFFKPYNQRLYKLLGEDWTEEWDNGEARVVPEAQIYNKDQVADDDAVAAKKEGSPVTSEEAAAIPEKKQLVSSKAAALHIAPKYQYPIYNQTQGTLFTDQWCDLTSVGWYPVASQHAWKLRAPYFMVPGAKVSGVALLQSYISQHPLVEVSRSKGVQFFLNKNFEDDFMDANGKIVVKKAREEMYNLEYHSDILKSDKSMISFDGSPGYFFFSTMTPQRILCVTPWIKLILVIRDPVERACAHHAFAEQRLGKKIDLEEWIKHDIEFLKQSGFLDATTEQEEDVAWPRYLNSTMEGPVGRGLYDVQLRQWQKAMRDAGRDPSTQIHIVRFEAMNADLVGQYGKVLDFLGLPYVPLQNRGDIGVSSYQQAVKKSTWDMVEELYEPYNRRLYERLGSHWNGVWEKH